MNGVLNGRVLDQFEEQIAEQVHAALCRVPRVFVMRPDGEQHVTLELHTKRGKVADYPSVSFDAALDLIDDVMGNGAYEVVPHAATPPLLAQKLKLARALAQAHCEGGVQ